jgi:hypothetical protein
MKLQIKEYLDKTRKFRRSSNCSHQHINQDIQKQIQHISDDEDDDDDDDDDDNDNNQNYQNDQININHLDQIKIQDEHLTQRENNLNTLRQNFKSVQHTSTSNFIRLLIIKRIRFRKIYLILSKRKR